MKRRASIPIRNFHSAGYHSGKRYNYMTPHRYYFSPARAVPPNLDEATPPNGQIAGMVWAVAQHAARGCRVCGVECKRIMATPPFEERVRQETVQRALHILVSMGGRRWLATLRRLLEMDAADQSAA